MIPDHGRRDRPDHLVRRDLDDRDVAAQTVAQVEVLLRLCDERAGRAQRGGGGRAGAADTLSLATPRPLRFTTDEGTWMSVDVSPDGRTLVFDLLGDLYTMPITGGQAARITSGQAFDAMPRFSPDGKQ